MSTYVIIPNWNGLDFIAGCLDSLALQTIPHHVIVVDNGSVDGSMELIRDRYPDVELLSFLDNAGFAGGVNRGIKAVLQRQDCEYIALFNNDAVAASTWLQRLTESAAAYSKPGIVTSKIRHFDNPMLDSTGDFYSTWGFPFPRGRDEFDEGQYDDEANRVVFGASGGASLYRADMLRQIGMFDERFFAYFEDVDISFRAQLAGWKVRYEPEAVVRHHIGGTSSRMDAGNNQVVAIQEERPSKFARYHTVKNFYYLYTKNMPGVLFWKYLPRFWASVAMMFISDVRRGLLAENLKATWVAFIHFPGVLQDRWKIQRGRKVSVGYIDSILYHDLPPLQKLRFRRFQKH